MGSKSTGNAYTMLPYNEHAHRYKVWYGIHSLCVDMWGEKITCMNAPEWNKPTWTNQFIIYNKYPWTAVLLYLKLTDNTAHQSFHHHNHLKVFLSTTFHYFLLLVSIANFKTF